MEVMKFSTEMSLHTLPALDRNKWMLSIFHVGVLFHSLPPSTIKGLNCYQLLKLNMFRLKKIDLAWHMRKS